MPKRTDQWYRQRACKVLEHAAMHCEFGSEPTDRIPDEADLQAAKTLLECRKLVERDSIERDIIEGRT